MKIPETKILRKGTSTYGAWKKGYLAAKAGEELKDCPYRCTGFQTKRFRTCWIDGWKRAQENP